MPGYGLRRLLISSNRRPKHHLQSGERKSITTDRVILVPGPAHEVQCVRDIYRMLICEAVRPCHCLRTEQQDIAYVGDSIWDYAAVYKVLTHPKYAGCHVFGRTSSKLYTPMVRLPKSAWVLTPGAFQPIVDHATFSKRRESCRTGRSTSRMRPCWMVRTLLATKGRLSLNIIKNSKDVPSPSTYRHRFGSLRRAYELIGYGRADQFGPIDLRRRTQALREDLISQIAAMLPNDVSVVRRGGRWRSRLQVGNGSIVSVLVARSVRIWKSRAMAG